MDRELVEKRLVRIVDSVERIRRLGEPDHLEQDVVQRGFIEHELQTSIQAALDVASIVVSSEGMSEPSTNHELFVLLSQAGWLPSERVDTFKRMVGFRNVAVRAYQELDKAIVADIALHRRGDFEAFARAVMAIDLVEP